MLLVPLWVAAVGAAVVVAAMLLLLTRDGASPAPGRAHHEQLLPHFQPIPAPKFAPSVARWDAPHAAPVAARARARAARVPAAASGPGRRVPSGHVAAPAPPGRAYTSLRPGHRQQTRITLSVAPSALPGGASPPRASTRTRLKAAVTESAKDGSSPAARNRPDTSAPKLSVAIAGGGVGGLTTALAMLKAGFDVTVYEKTGEFARFGGPIQLASNALSTLKAIDERTFERVMRAFTFTGTRRCGIKDGKRSNGQFRMTPVADPTYLVDKDTPADWFVSFPLKGCADLFGLPYTGVIDRPDLQDILLDECSQLKADFISNGNAVSSYKDMAEDEEPDATGVEVTLEDGTKHRHDILVGADGIWSSVRAQMYNEGDVKAPSADGKKRQGCPYSGYTVYAGEAIMELPDYYECGYNVYVGPGKYFVKSDVGRGRVQWYAFLEQPPGTAKVRDSWAAGDVDAATAAYGDDEASKQLAEKAGADVIEYLKLMHEGWSDEVFQILENTPAASVEQRDLYDRWPEFFRSWAQGPTVLLGDAVHPMMPNLGQGGCQSIEDAYILTQTLLASHTYSRGAGGEGGVTAGQIDHQTNVEALQTFYKKRIVRVSAVSLLSRLASDLIINAFDTPWSPHDDKGSSWKSYLTFFWKPLLQYVIFPAQFAFLYSYHPTGNMGNLPKRLENEWRERHQAASKEAFRLQSEGQVAATSPSFFAKAEE